MAATGSSASNDTGFELRVGGEPSPPVQRHRHRVDMRWGRVGMAQLEDEEFLQQQLRRLEVAAGAHHADRGAQRPAAGERSGHQNDVSLRDRLVDARSKAERRVRPDHEGDEEDVKTENAQAATVTGGTAMDPDAAEERKRELSNALCILGNLAPSERHALMLQRLTGSLQRQCATPNPVYKLIALRRQILRRVQEAVAAQHQHQKVSSTQWSAVVELMKKTVCATTEVESSDILSDPLYQMAPLSTITGSLNTSVATTATTAQINAAKPALRAKNVNVAEAAVGLQALSWLLACLCDPVMNSVQQQKHFLNDIVHQLSVMPQLVFAVQCDDEPSKVNATSDERTGPSSQPRAVRNTELLEVIEYAQRFLLDQCPRPPTKAIPTSPKVHAITPVNGDFDLDDRTNAVSGLIYLAGATGSLRDYLVVLKMLLGVPDVSQEPTTPCPCASPSPSPHLGTSPSKQEMVRAMNDCHSQSEVAIDTSATKNQPTLSGRKARTNEETNGDNDELMNGVEIELPLQTYRKPGTKGGKVHTVSSTNPVTSVKISGLSSGTQTYRPNGTVSPKLTLKSREMDDIVDAASTGRFSLDCSVSGNGSTGRVSALSSSRTEHSLRCPKLKPLHAQSVILQLNNAKTSSPKLFLRGGNAGTGSSHEFQAANGGDYTDDREVWSCGQNSYGELGHGDTVPRKSFERIESLQRKDIVLVGAGNEHTLALSSDGKVFTCGYNDNGQCGQGTTARVSHMTEIPQLGDNRVTQVHAFNGCEHSVLVMSSGRAATCGYNYRGQLGHGNTTSESMPKVIRSLEGRAVRLVSCSYYHTVMTCEDVGGGGKYVLTFGRNDYGQLGHNDTIDRKVPQHVGALNDHHIVSVACGQYHTMVVTSTGKVFGFGKNDYGQLGVDSIDNQLLPVQVRGGLDKLVVQEIRCGYYHSIALCSGAHLYGFGRNDYGQLGLAKATMQAAANFQLQQQRFSQPYLIDELEGNEIVRFACGCYHTVAVSESGMLYVFGRNNHGQLGTGDTNERLFPFPIDDFLGKRVAYVAAGFYHTVVLTGGTEEEKDDQARVGEGIDANGYGVVENLDAGSCLSYESILDSSVMTDFVHRSPEPNRRHLRSTNDLNRSGKSDAACPLTDADPVECDSPADSAGDFRDEDSSAQGDAKICDLKAPAKLNESTLTAIFIFAQLDRLCQGFLTKQGALQTTWAASLKHAEAVFLGAQNPTITSTAADLIAQFPGAFEPYVIDVRSETFEHLAFMMRFLCSKKVTEVSELETRLSSQSQMRSLPESTPRLSPLADGSVNLHLYMLLVCLRLIRANMAQLMRSGIGQMIIAFVETSAEACPSKNIKPNAQELMRLWNSVQHVRDVLMSIIDMKYRRTTHFDGDFGKFTDDIMLCASTEAVTALTEAFDIFVPCRCLQIQFIVHVLCVEHGGDSECWCQSTCRHGMKFAGRLPKAKKLILGPLLKRMTDDAFILKLIPLSLPTSLSCASMDTSSIGSNVQLELLPYLSRMYHALLDHMAFDFARNVDDLSSRASVGAQANARGANTSISLIVGILRLLQKHLVCWAQSCREWQRNVNSLLCAPEQSPMHEVVCAVIDCEFRMDKLDDTVPIQWRAMIELALAVISVSCQHLAQINSITSRCRRQRHQPTSAEREDALVGPLQAVESSIVGQFLPALLTGLFEFSNNPLFATALLPNLKGLLKLIDAFNRQHSELETADKTFVEFVSHSYGRGASSARGNDRRPPVGANTRLDVQRGKNGLPVSANVSDALTLPWNFRLEKELAVLTAEMALTLVVGEPVFQWAVPSCGEKAAISSESTWFSSSLLRGGLSSNVLAKGVKMSITSPFRRTVLHSPFSTVAKSLPSSLSNEFAAFTLILPPTGAVEPEYSNNSQGVLKGAMDVRKYRRLFSSVAIRKFLACLVLDALPPDTDDSAAGQAICEWVRDYYARKDSSYRMLVQLGKKSRQSGHSVDPRDEQIRANDIRIESASFAVLLHHNALAIQALQLAQAHQVGGQHNTQRPPPASFLRLWSFVADLRRQLAAKKTTLKNQLSKSQDGDTGDPLDQILRLQRRWINRCELLVMLDVHDEEEHRNLERDAGFIAPCNPAFINSSCIPASDFEASSLKAHMETRYTEHDLPFVVAYPWSKWRLVRTLMHTTARWKACSSGHKMVKASSTISSTSRQAINFISCEEPVSSPMAIRQLLVDPCRRRSCSIRGFEMLWEILSTMSFESMQVDVVHQVSQALVFQHAGVQEASVLRNSGIFYTDLYNNAKSDLFMQLTDLIAHKAASAVEADDCNGPGADFWILTELLSSWGCKFDIEQFEFVSDIGVLPLLQRLLQAFSDPDLVEIERARRALPSRVNSSIAGNDSSRCSTVSSRTLGLASANKQNQHLYQTLWTIFQSICVNFTTPTSQLGVVAGDTNADVSPALSSPFEVIHVEAARLTDAVVPRRPAISLDAVGSTPNAAIRRSFDILSTVTRISRLHKRLTFDYQDMLNPSPGKVPMSPLLKANEFSITMWMFITGQSGTAGAQPAEGSLDRKLVFLRGSSNELSPYLMLVPEGVDLWQIEVGFVLGFSSDDEPSRTKNGNILCERVLSKEPVQSGRWIHIAIVVEATKVRLYINGAVDSQRMITSQYTAAWATRDVNLPFHFGRFPPSISSLLDENRSVVPALRLLSCSLLSAKSSSTRHPQIVPGVPSDPTDFGCFDGWLSQFRFHNRSLSPIHVRIVYDELKPGTAASSPAQCVFDTAFQSARLLDMHALLIQLSSCPEGREHFRSHFSQWMLLLWRTFVYTQSTQLQQSSLRVLRSLLPHHHPSSVADALLSVSKDDENNLASPPEYFGFYSSDELFVQHVLRIIGFGRARVQASCNDRSNPTGDTIPAIETEGKGCKLPWSLVIPDGVHGAVFSQLNDCKGSSLNQQLPANMVQLEEAAKQRTIIVVNELVELIRYLFALRRDQTSALWTKSIGKTICSILANTSTHEGTSNIGCDAGTFVFGKYAVDHTALREAELIGCLYLLGGSMESLRPGTTAQLQITGDPVRIIAVESLESKVPGDKNSAGSAACIPMDSVNEHNSDIRQLRNNRCNKQRHSVENVRCDEIVPCQTQSVLQLSFQFQDDDRGEQWDIGSMLAQHTRLILPRLSELMTSATATCPVMNNVIEAEKISVEQNMRAIQSGNLMLRSVVQAVEDKKCAIKLLGDRELMTTVFKLSATNDGGSAFAALTIVERKVFRLRQRLYEVLIDLGDQVDLELAQLLSQSAALEQGHLEPEMTSGQVDANSIESGGVQHHESYGSPKAIAEHQSFRDTQQDYDVGGTDDNEIDSGVDDEGEDESADEPDNIMEDGIEGDEDSEHDEDHNSECVDELMLMGFPEEWCVLALKQTESDIVAASAWIVDNLDYLSKLQISLDKKRDAEQESERFNDEDDDVVQDDANELKQEAYVAEGKEKHCFGDSLDKPDRNELSLNAGHIQSAEGVITFAAEQNAHSTDSSVNYLPPSLNDKEMGRKIFGEMYFPFEEGGYLSNSRCLAMWKPTNMELTTSSAEPTPSSTSDSSSSSTVAFIDNDFELELTQLTVPGLVQLLRSLERQLAILYCRLAAARILKHAPDVWGSKDANVISYSLWLQLVKVVVMRGDQFSNYLAPSDQRPTSSHDVCESILASSISLFVVNDHVRFFQAVIAFIIDQVDAATVGKQYEAALWTQRELKRADKLVVAEPAVEVAAWLVDKVLADEFAPFVADMTLEVLPLIQHLRSSLSGTNLPLKCFSLHTISQVLSLFRKRGDESAGSLSMLIAGAKLTVPDFLAAAKQRHSREVLQERLLYSVYLQAYVELLHTLQIASSRSSDTVGLHQPIVGTFDLGTVSAGADDAPTSALDEPSPTFDRKANRSTLLTYSDDGQTVAYSGSDAWKAASAERGFATGKHSWVVQIEKSNSSYVFVGVATRRANVDSFLGADEHSWGFIGDKALYYQRNRIRSFGEAFGEGDAIGVHLDCERGTLAFSKNGVHMGVAFDNVVGEVYPAVALYSRHQRVSLAACSPTTGMRDEEQDPWLNTSLSLSSLPNLPSWGRDTETNGSLEDCMVACELIECMLGHRPIRVELMDAAYKLTTHWLAGTRQFVTTRAGWALWVDITSAACKDFGFQAGERVRTTRGNGTALGIAWGRVWVQVDGENGAWFFHPTRLRTLTLAMTITDLKTPQQQSTAVVTDKADGNTSSRNNSPSDTTELSRQEFEHGAQDTSWSVRQDRELLHIVNEFCESSRTSPWNLSPSALLRLLREKQVVAGSGVLLDAANGQCSAERLVIARFALLRFLNLSLRRALPFFDLTWSYFAPRTRMHPCMLLSTCRGSVFLCLKNDQFTALMQRTANSPRRSDDEYDYPEDLPHLQVNRLKAAAAKCHPGSTKSLFLSLFGQAFEVLHFLPLKTLRMVYSHPMDDGQQRSFKVKFEGEGADDYGGPYREFFSQFFAELQALEDPAGDSSSDANSNQDLGDSVSKATATKCFLPFLVPSPNWRNGVGSSREKFVLNAAVLAQSTSPSEPRSLTESPEEKRQLLREMFVFLGQMLAICLRTGVCVRLDLAMCVWKQLVAEEDANGRDIDIDDADDVLTSLKEIDFVAYSLWKTLKTILESYHQIKGDGGSLADSRLLKLEEQLAAMDLDFTTTLSDGRTVELLTARRGEVVTLSNLGEYLHAMLNARVHEARDAVSLIKQGINSILPVSAIGVLTWQELETRMCGVDEIDVELLRANTEYDEDVAPTDEFILRFWRVLEAMATADRRAFLRFVWARSRLPLAAAQFHQKFKIQSLAIAGSNGEPVAATAASMDAQLPKSHTCFFALQLPRYSSDDVCRQRLLYAIHNCVEMDGDFRLADTEMGGWTDVSAGDQLRL